MRGFVVSLLAIVGCSKPAATAECPHRVKVEMKRVDEGSDLMERVMRYVEEHPGDAAGVQTEMDPWVLEDIAADGLPRNTQHFRDIYARAAERQALEAFFEGLARKDATFKPPGDHQLVFEHVARADEAAYWRSYYVRAKTLLSDRDIASAEQRDNDGGRPMALFTLNAEGAKQLAEVSRANAGHKVAVLVDGEVWSAPVINGEMRGGKFSTLAVSPEAASELIERLRCPK